MRSLDDDDETVAVDVKKGSSSAQPAWMRTLRDSCLEWLAILPKVSFLSVAFSYSADAESRPQSLDLSLDDRFRGNCEEPLVSFLRARGIPSQQARSRNSFRPRQPRSSLQRRTQANERSSLPPLGSHKGYRSLLVASLPLPNPRRGKLDRRFLETNRSTRNYRPSERFHSSSRLPRFALPTSRLHHGVSTSNCPRYWILAGTARTPSRSRTDG